MLNSKTFSDILSDHLSAPTEDFTAGWESVLDPQGLSELLTSVPVYHVRVQSKYPVKPRPKVVIRAPAHVFTEMQSQCYQLLKSYGGSLEDNFNQTELKSAYRKAVLRTHPDLGGTGETFQQVRKSYQILISLVKTQA